jgi:hypothetical protein
LTSIGLYTHTKTQARISIYIACATVISHDFTATEKPVQAEQKQTCEAVRSELTTPETA